MLRLLVRRQQLLLDHYSDCDRHPLLLRLRIARKRFYAPAFSRARRFFTEDFGNTKGKEGVCP
jgi:hypothetical protein